MCANFQTWSKPSQIYSKNVPMQKDVSNSRLEEVFQIFV